jgi:hypothetical protein
MRDAGGSCTHRNAVEHDALAATPSSAYHAHMTIFASSAARFLLQAAAAHDTVIMRQVPPVRSWFEQVVFIASGISTLLVLVLVTGLVAAMLAVRRSVRRAHEALYLRIAEFGKRVDEFNDLLGRVQRRAETVVSVGEKAMDGVAAWGAGKLGQKLGEKVGEQIDEKFGSRRRRRRKPRGARPANSGGATRESQVEAKLDDRRGADTNDDEGDSPYDDSRGNRK